MVGLGRYLAQMFEGVDAAAVAVTPHNPDSVMAHRLHVHHFERRRIHLKRPGIDGGRLGHSAVRAAAYGAGAMVAKVAQSVFAGMAVLPIDLDSLRFGDRDVLG